MDLQIKRSTLLLMTSISRSIFLGFEWPAVSRWVLGQDIVISASKRQLCIHSVRFSEAWRNVI